MTVRIAAALERRKREGRENRIRVVVAYGECSRKLGRPATLRDVAAVVKLNHKTVWKHLDAALPNRLKLSHVNAIKGKAVEEANRLRVVAAYEALAAEGGCVSAGEIVRETGLGLSTVRKHLPTIQRGSTPRAAAADACRRRIAEALEQLTAEGRTPTPSAVGRLAGVERRTAAKHLAAILHIPTHDADAAYEDCRRRIVEALERIAADGKPPTPSAVARIAGVGRKTTVKHLAAMNAATFSREIGSLDKEDHDEIQRRIAVVRKWKTANPSTGGLDGHVLSQILPD